MPNDGLIYYRSILNIERLMPVSPQALSEVLTQKSYEFVKPYQLRFGLGRILGVGLVLSEGEEHKAHRKLLKPAFDFRHIKDLYPTFWSKACNLVSHLMVETQKQAQDSKDYSAVTVVEIGNWVSRATLDIIGVAGLGKDFNAIENPNTELNATYRKVFQPSKAGQILNFAGLFLPQWFIRLIPISHNSSIFEASETIRKVCRQLIHEKRQRLKEKRVDFDILSVAVESGGFTDEELVNELMTFLAAGHETTAASLTWAIYLLCKNPEAQIRLRNEIRATLPSVNSTEEQMNCQILESCHYLHAVCNEVLRFHAPLPITVREAGQNTTILNQPVPKGTSIIIAPWAVNKSIELWGADAMIFNPERWMSGSKAGNGGAENHFAFMTFLHGPRGCIGQQFARAEFACLLGALVGRFEFELEYPDRVIEIKGGITARPKGGLPVKMKVVQGW